MARVAEALANLGTELRGIVTFGKLQAGIAYARCRSARPPRPRLADTRERRW